MKIIDQREIEQLELLVRQANVFGNHVFMENDQGAGWSTKTVEMKEKELMKKIHDDIGTADGSSARSIHTPAFTWVVQDFFQDMASGGNETAGSAKDWMDKLLDSQPREDGASRTLRGIFASTDCKTLFIPTLQGKQQLAQLDNPAVRMHEDYLADLEGLKASLISNLEEREKKLVPLLGLQVPPSLLSDEAT